MAANIDAEHTRSVVLMRRPSTKRWKFSFEFFYDKIMISEVISPTSGPKSSKCYVALRMYSFKAKYKQKINIYTNERKTKHKNRNFGKCLLYLIENMIFSSK